MSLLSVLPARYAKALAALVTVAITYLEAYGPTWHLVPACLAIAGVLGVGGIPNTPPATVMMAPHVHVNPPAPAPPVYTPPATS